MIKFDENERKILKRLIANNTICLKSISTGKYLKLTTDNIKYLSSKINTLKQGAIFIICGLNIKIRRYGLSFLDFQEKFKPQFMFKIADYMINNKINEKEKAIIFKILNKIYSPLYWQYNIFAQAGNLDFNKAIKLIKDSSISFEGIYLDNLAIYTENYYGNFKAIDAREFYNKNINNDDIYINGIRLDKINADTFSEIKTNIIKELINRQKQLSIKHT